MPFRRSLTWWSLLLCATPCLGADKGRLEVQIVDKQTNQPMAARMHLKDQQGKVVRIPKAPFWRDHFAIDGSNVLELPLGAYTFELEAGPEFKLLLDAVETEQLEGRITTREEALAFVSR